MPKKVSTELLIMRGVIAGLTPEEQKEVAEAAEELRAILEKHGDAGACAVGLVVAELAAEED